MGRLNVGGGSAVEIMVMMSRGLSEWKSEPGVSSKSRFGCSQLFQPGGPFDAWEPLPRSDPRSPPFHAFVYHAC